MAIKINTLDRKSRHMAGNELGNMQVITGSNPLLVHGGWNFVRTLSDGFTLAGLHGDHQCLVFEPLREPLVELRRHGTKNLLMSDDHKGARSMDH